MSGKRETVYFFALNVASKFVTYLLLIAFANLFAILDYGEAAFALSAFTIVGVLAQLGAPQAFVPYLVKKDPRAKSIFWFLVLLTAAFTIAGLVVCLRYAWITPLMLSLPFLLFYGVGRTILRAQHKHHLVQAGDSLAVLLAFAFVVLFKDFGKTGIMLAYAASNILVSLAVAWWTRSELKKLVLPIQFKRPAVFEYAKKASIVFLVFISMDVLNKVDSLILGALSSYPNVARYTIAYSFASVISAIPIAISMFLLTRAAEIKEEHVSKAVFLRSARISFSLSLLAAIALNALVYPLTQFFFQKYAGVEPFVAILSIGLVFYSVYFLFFNYFTGRMAPEKAAKPMLFAAVVNVILDVALIPPFGVYGICLATLIAHFSALMIFGLKTFTLKRLAVFYAAPVFIVAAFLLHEWGLLVLPVAAAFLWLSRSFTAGEARVLEETLVKRCA